MRRGIRWAVLPLLMGGWAAGETNAGLAEKIAALVAQSNCVQRGHFGFQFVNVATGEVLAEKDAAEFFSPASNTKLYTTALGLVRLGADYRFTTELRTQTSWVAGQPVIHDLQLVGGGDPNLSGRVLPYARDSVDGDPVAPLAELADALVAAGIREIDGDVTGVAARYPGDRYPDGWTIDDSLYGYGAPVSALTVNDGIVTISVAATAEGELPDVQLRPNGPFIVLNETVTDASGETHLHVTRALGSNEVVVRGSIGGKSPVWQEDLGVEDPALYAARALVDLLRERGVTVRGEARAEYDDLSEAGTVLAKRQSAPLSQAIQVINKVSQNLHAEMLLREVARVTQGAGTLETGLKERESFLREAGVTADGTGTALVDGSGLARGDLTTPLSTVTLLRYMWARPERDVWLRSLPVGGVDGSLQTHFGGVKGAERIHAKTGSLSHVNTLSGYIERGDGSWLVFSVMVNATVDHQAEVHSFIEKLCALFL